MLNTRQVEVFWAIMRSGGVTAAADLLGVSQPAVSKVLHHMEDQLKMKLFERRNGRLYPTVEANQLASMAKTVFDNIENLKRAAIDYRENRSGRVQLCAVPTLATTFLPKPVANFLRDKPRVDVSIKISTMRHIVSRVSLQQADMGLIYGTVNDANVVATPLGPGRLICIVHRDHRLARKSAISPEDLTDERIISYHRATIGGEAVRAALRPDGPRITIECEHALMAVLLVSEELGVALVPHPLSLLPRFPEVRVVPFESDVEIRPHVIQRKSPQVSRLSAALLVEIQAWVALQTEEYGWL